MVRFSRPIPPLQTTNRRTLVNPPKIANTPQRHANTTIPRACENRRGCSDQSRVSRPSHRPMMAWWAVVPPALECRGGEGGGGRGGEKPGCLSLSRSPALPLSHSPPRPLVVVPEERLE